MPTLIRCVVLPLLALLLAAAPQAADPDLAGLADAQRLDRLSPRSVLSYLATSLNPGQTLEDLAAHLGLTPEELQKLLFSPTDTVDGLRIKVAQERVNDAPGLMRQLMAEGKISAEFLGMGQASQAMTACNLLKNLAGEKTTATEALAELAGVAGLLEQLDRAGALAGTVLGPVSAWTCQELALVLRKYLDKVRPVAQTPDQRQLLTGRLESALPPGPWSMLLSWA